MIQTGIVFSNNKLTKMKRILLLPIIAAFAIPLSCTKDFERINTNPTAASPASFDANYFLSNAQNTYKEGIAGDRKSVV